MSLENANFIHQLNSSNPAGPDKLSNGDDHLRLIKAALKATFPNFTGALTLTNDQLNGIASSLVPVGVIVDFYGPAESVPAGWAICNGQTVPLSSGLGSITTPDLRDRVIAGASVAHPANTAYGQASRTVTTEGAGDHTHTATTASAGAASVNITIGGTALTVEQLPAHQHGSGITPDNVGNPYPNGSNPGSGTPVQKAAGGSGNQTPNTLNAGGGQPHTHTASGGEVPGHTHAITVGAVGVHGHAVTVDVTQPTVALHKIIKV